MAGIRKTEFRDKFVAMLADLFEQDAAPEVGFSTTGEGHLIIEVDGLTIDDDGNIVLTEREFEWTGTVTFTVTGTVTATSRDAAREAVEEMLPNGEATFGYGWGDLTVDHTTVNDYEVDEVY